MDWKCDSSCMTDSDEGLEHWKSILYELHGHRCERITNSIRWVGSEERASPTFDGMFNLEEFIAQFSEKVPDSQKMETLDSVFRATAARWWNGHKQHIHSWGDCQKFLGLRFVDQPPVRTQKCHIFIHLSVHYSLHFIALLNLDHIIFINTFEFHIIIFHFIHFSIKSEFMIKY